METTKPIWLTVAEAFVGLAEVPGATSNPVILRWAADLKAPAYTNDDEPWCALFLNRVMLACQLPVAGTGYDLLRAASFAAWGQPISATLGAVLVFRRPAGHHVGIYLGERADAYYVLGGNTGNKVGAAWIGKDRLVAVRWATNLPIGTTQVLLTDVGVPSTNEV